MPRVSAFYGVAIYATLLEAACPMTSKIPQCTSLT